VATPKPSPIAAACPPNAGHWAGTEVQAAHWLLSCAITGIDGLDTDDRHTTVLRRQLTSAHNLLRE
jgi:hypothetical protein